MTVGNDKPVYRCDRSLETGVLMHSPLPYHPLGGSEVLHQSGGLVLCNVCQSQQDSWPWWAESGLKVDARRRHGRGYGSGCLGDTNRNRLFRERSQRVTDFLRSLDKHIHCLG